MIYHFHFFIALKDHCRRLAGHARGGALGRVSLGGLDKLPPPQQSNPNYLTCISSCTRDSFHAQSTLSASHLPQYVRQDFLLAPQSCLDLTLIHPPITQNPQPRAFKLQGPIPFSPFTAITGPYFRTKRRSISLFPIASIQNTSVMSRSWGTQAKEPTLCRNPDHRRTE